MAERPLAEHIDLTTRTYSSPSLIVIVKSGDIFSRYLSHICQREEIRAVRIDEFFKRSENRKTEVGVFFLFPPGSQGQIGGLF